MTRLNLEELESRDTPSLSIVPTFDSTITSDPNAATIEATINTAIHSLEAAIQNSVTVYISFSEMSSGLGTSSWTYDIVDYPSYRAALAAAATSPVDASAVASLPNTANNPVNGFPYMALKDANAIALGLEIATAAGDVGINTSICNLSRTNINPGLYDLQSVATHEMDEILGFQSSLTGQDQGATPWTGVVWPSDLFRYAATGVRSWSTTATDPAYFSVDGGATVLAHFNQIENGDMSDWSGADGALVQNATASGGGSTPNLGVEITELDAIGYTINQPAVVSFTVNNGLPQRSMVNSLTLVFNEPVTITSAAFSLALKPFTDNGVSGLLVGNTSTILTTSSADGVTWNVTFSGSSVVGGSISDGDYYLNLAAGSVGVIGDSSITNSTYQNSFYRLFGDANGSGLVTNPNYDSFKAAFGATSTSDPNYNAAFDYYGNGFITNPAYDQFKSRFGTVWSNL